MSGGATELYDRFLSEFDYKQSSGLEEIESKDRSNKKLEKLERLGIDAVYSGLADGGHNSLIYFKKFEHQSKEELRKLYQRIWNEGRASLLIVVLPKEIRVYNPNAGPILSDNESIDDGQGRLIESIDLRNKALEDAPGIEIYDRQFIDTRKFWKLKRDEFSQTSRVDQYLHNDLKALKHYLEEELNLNVTHANSLIIKSIFILFLEDRGFITDDFYNSLDFEGPYKNILPGPDETYRLFQDIEDRFNGDIFKFSQGEREAVDSIHLEIVKRFLQGENLKTGQKRLFPYSFDIIPVELISSIYEDFVPSEEGVYYTPYYLVDFILGDFSEETFDTSSKILDPACGSGVFLVAAFEKFLQQIQEEKGQLDSDDLIEIATENIVGVDRNAEAVQITAFSLSLKILEHLDRDNGADPLQLPNLIGENVFEKDFFDPDAEFNTEEYDLVVGNPPWVPMGDSQGLAYCKEHNYPTGNNQLALAFMWKSLDLLSEHGEACLLVPTRDVLLNKRTQSFRAKFFANASVRSIINLSLLRKRLFENATNPCSVVCFSPRTASHEEIQYITPKYQSPGISQSIWIDYDDIKYLPGDESNKAVWKTAMFGGTLDIELIRRLADEPTIQEFINEYELETGEGFQIGGQKNKENHRIKQLPFLPTRHHQPYFIGSDAFESLNETTFHRPRPNTKIWTGPRVLVKEGITISESPKFRSAYIEQDATFTHSISAIRGTEEDSDLLKSLNLVFNSDLAQYYFFMTSSKWGVERDMVEKFEIMQFPFPFDQLETESPELARLHDQILEAKQIGDQEAAKDRLKEAESRIYRIYGLTKEEESLIQSRVRHTIDYFHNKEKSHGASPPSTRQVKKYVETVSGSLNQFLSDSPYKVSAEYYTQDRGLTRFGELSDAGGETLPLNLVTFKLDDQSSISVSGASDELRRKIRKLDNQLIQRGGQSIFFNRRDIIYHDKEVHVIKPNELNSWDMASAVNDINWLIGEFIGRGARAAR